MKFNEIEKYDSDSHILLNENFDMLAKELTSNILLLDELPAKVIPKTMVIIAEEGSEIITSRHAPEGMDGRIWLRINKPYDHFFDSLKSPMVIYRSANIFQNGSWQAVDAYYAYFDEWYQFSRTGMDYRMTQFFAIPAETSCLRLKIEKPPFSENVMIRYKMEPWEESDDYDTGTFVANILDDSIYKNANDWYKLSGLVDGAMYYFKAFVNNITPPLHENETHCRAGTLHIELNFEGITGTVINDTSSYNRNASATNIPIGPGHVGSKAVPNGSNSNVILGTNSNINLESSTICFWLTPHANDLANQTLGYKIWHIWYRAANSYSGLSSTYKQCYGQTYLKLDFTQNAVRIHGFGNNGYIDTSLEAAVPTFICVKRTGMNITYIKNDRIIGTGVGNANNISYVLYGGISTSTAFSCSNAIYQGSLFCNSTPTSPAAANNNRTSDITYSAYSASDCDQFRMYNKELTFEEVMNIYNEGRGC